MTIYIGSEQSTCLFPAWACPSFLAWARPCFLASFSGRVLVFWPGPVLLFAGWARTLLGEKLCFLLYGQTRPFCWGRRGRREERGGTPRPKLQSLQGPRELAQKSGGPWAMSRPGPPPSSLKPALLKSLSTASLNYFSNAILSIGWHRGMHEQPL